MDVSRVWDDSRCTLIPAKPYQISSKLHRVIFLSLILLNRLVQYIEYRGNELNSSEKYGGFVQS